MMDNDMAPRNGSVGEGCFAFTVFTKEGGPMCAELQGQKVTLDNKMQITTLRGTKFQIGVPVSNTR
jgi:hypothetical protein